MERFELRVQGPILSDAEPDSDCPKGPLVFGREPAHLKPRSRAGLAGPRGPHKPERTSVVYKAYVLKTNSSIDIMSIHELPISGGSHTSGPTTNFG